MKTILIALLIVIILVALLFVISIILEARRQRQNQVESILIDKIVDNVLQYWGPSQVTPFEKESRETVKPEEEDSPPAFDSFNTAGTDVPDKAISTDVISDRFEDAARLVVSTQSCVRSDLQRKLAIGYAKAGCILDELEAAGIVGPVIEKKPREVLVKDFSELEQILSKYTSLPNVRGKRQYSQEAKTSIDVLYQGLMKE